jgi:release factor glutamine methyltransferase
MNGISARRPCTRQRAWDRGVALLEAAGIATGEARVEAAVLLRHAAGISREELLIRPAAVLSRDAARVYAALIRERAAGRPTAYLIGHREFFGLDLAVDERVLIPRPETERLVEVVRAAVEDLPAPLIVDIGTGSGAVAIALASALPRARLVATDASPEALAVGRLNAARHAVASRIAWAEGEDVAPLAAMGLDGRVDAIASNPPYIPTADLPDLPREVREHEPRLALDGGPDGLTVHRRIIAGAPRYLRPGGVLALEVAAVSGQPGAVARLMTASGAYRRPEVVRDYAGMERVVAAARVDTRRA